MHLSLQAMHTHLYLTGVQWFLSVREVVYQAAVVYARMLHCMYALFYVRVGLRSCAYCLWAFACPFYGHERVILCLCPFHFMGMPVFYMHARVIYGSARLFVLEHECFIVDRHVHLFVCGSSFFMGMCVLLHIVMPVYFYEHVRIFFIGIHVSFFWTCAFLWLWFCACIILWACRVFTYGHAYNCVYMHDCFINTSHVYACFFMCIIK